MSHDSCVTIPRGAMGLSAVWLWYFMIIFTFSEYMYAMNKDFCTLLVYSFESYQLGKSSF